MTRRIPRVVLTSIVVAATAGLTGPLLRVPASATTNGDRVRALLRAHGAGRSVLAWQLERSIA